MPTEIVPFKPSKAPLPEKGKIEPPSPGFYANVPFETYCRWDAMNMHTLKWGRISMEHLKAAIDGYMEKETPALGFGKAMHMRLLEPDAYNETFVVKYPCSSIIKTKSSKKHGKACGAKGVATDGVNWFCGTHANDSCYTPKSTVSLEEHERLEAIAERVKNSDVCKLLKQHGGVETCAIVELGGVLCKIRMDKFIGDWAACPISVVDLKKVQLGKGGDQPFSRSVDNYDYAMQSAMYCDVVQALTGDKATFVWIVIEEMYPYALNFGWCDEESIRVGRYQYRKALEEYKNCLLSGVWPGYSQDLHPMGMTDWTKRNFAGLGLAYDD